MVVRARCSAIRGSRVVWAALLVIQCAVIAACTLQSYSPRPLAPQAIIQDLRSRTLDDPQLREFMAAHKAAQSAWPRGKWDLSALTLAAFYFHPDLDVSRAKLIAARAAQRSAVAKPPVGLEFLPEIIRPAAGKAPWALGFVLELPLLGGDRRLARVEQAQAQASVARIDGASAAWQVRSQLREALRQFHSAGREVELAQQEAAARQEIVRLLEKRLAAGVAAHSEISNARMAQTGADQRVAAAQSKMEHAVPRIAAAVGISAEHLSAKQWDLAVFATAAPLVSIDARALEDAAFANRADVQRELGQYLASEAELKEEIVKQYPEFRLKPAYQRDQGDNRFGIGLGLTLPLPHGNEGPIGEALARRELQARRALALHAQVLAQVQAAVAQYRGALRQLALARRALTQHAERARAMERQFGRGAADRLELAQAKLEVLVARGAEQAALDDIQRVVGLVEDAVQRPFDGSAELTFDPDAVGHRAKTAEGM